MANAGFLTSVRQAASIRANPAEANHAVFSDELASGRGVGNASAAGQAFCGRDRVAGSDRARGEE